jgi:hypothetical protein
VALADVQIQPHAFVQLFLFGILPQDRLEQFERVIVVVALEDC